MIAYMGINGADEKGDGDDGSLCKVFLLTSLERITAVLLLLCRAAGPAAPCKHCFLR